MTLTATIEVTVTFHNGQKQKIKLRGTPGEIIPPIRHAVSRRGMLEFDAYKRADSNVDYLVAADSYRAVEIARL